MAREKAVVVGAGGISRAWFGPLAAEKVNVVGVVDLKLDAARERIEQYGLKCAASTDLPATLKRTRPDFVVDLTVPEAHCSVTCTALAHGCHVIGEKPMASSMAEARRMVRAADRAGRCYMVSQSRRWDARHEVVRRVAAGGKLGTLTTINCDFYIPAHFGGFRVKMASPLILDMAIHQFDLARYFTGADPKAVYAYEFNPPGSWYAGDAAASCIFEMSDGIVFTFRGSWCAEGCQTSWNGNWRIIGEKGTLLYENDRPPVAQVAGDKQAFFRGTKDVKIPPERLKHPGQHGALREMLARIRRGKTPPCECHDNIKSLSMVFAAMDSARKHRRVAIG
ncbi:MAG TPA: Gfo/Idh/MocA family oxidoreductase [Phycisphaerae bacterium]|nr:Gfo/Idh/MocA family oxidoreductase [Phycisphaerae bacterium]HUU23671.1 Gfo/Idh/MocA family oxidoreductase [Phycisphaerae bacterium]